MLPIAELNFTWPEFPLAMLLLLVLALIAIVAPIALKIEISRQRMAREKDGLAAEEVNGPTCRAKAREKHQHLG